MRRGIIAGGAATTMAALALSAIPADAAVRGGESIEVFTGSDLISLTSYPANTDVRVEVLRQGFVIGKAVKTTDADGVIEMNHVGAQANDCFDPPSSPDVKPGDTIRTTVLPAGTNVDTSVVRGVWIDDIQYDVPTANDITVTGRVRLAGPAKVVPVTDVLELRINKDRAWDGTGRRDNREDIGRSVEADGTWSRVISGSVADVNEAEASSETFLEWSSAAADFPPELTVAEFGPAEALVGCPPAQQGPTAPQLAAAQDSGKKGDHITNKAANLTFAGLAGSDAESDDAEPGPNAQVQLLVDGAVKATGTASASGVYRFTGITLAPRARAYSLKVRAKDPGAAPMFDSPLRSVRIDTVMPAAVLRQLAPKPLHLAGPERLHAVYRVSEGARLNARIHKAGSTHAVKTFAVRSTKGAQLVEYFWNGKNSVRRDVAPGRYRMLLTATDAAGNKSTERATFRVVQ